MLDLQWCFFKVVWVYFHGFDATYIICECADSFIQECVEIPVISIYFLSYWIFLWDYCIILYWIKSVCKFFTGKVCYYNPYCIGSTYKRTNKNKPFYHSFISSLYFFLFYILLCDSIKNILLSSMLLCCLFLPWVLFIVGMVHRNKWSPV